MFFAANMLVFAAAAWSGASIAFAFFVWASIYGVMVVAQLWAFAADSFNLKSGQRLFPVIMVGANIGALVGAKTAQLAVAGADAGRTDGRGGAAAVRDRWCWRPGARRGARRLARDRGRARQARAEAAGRHRARAARPLPAADRDSWSCCSTGSTPRANSSSRTSCSATRRRASLASGGALDPGVLITEFYGGFQFWVTVVGLAIQLFLVARIYRTVGVRGALLVLPGQWRRSATGCWRCRRCWAASCRSSR